MTDEQFAACIVAGIQTRIDQIRKEGDIDRAVLVALLKASKAAVESYRTPVESGVRMIPIPVHLYNALVDAVTAAGLMIDADVR